jgi:SAM-dependent methyltransferase
MQVFISWSGRRSKQIATYLSFWLKEVFIDAPLEIFVSTEDIRAGADFSDEISGNLKRSGYGILCLTPENLNAPWVLFESGALSLAAGKGSVCPFLHDFDSAHLRRPLEQFNAVKADLEGTRKLVFTINRILEERQLPERQLGINFDFLWPKLCDQLKSIPSSNSDISLGISRLQQELPLTLGLIKEKKWFASNSYFAQVLYDSINNFKAALEESGPYYDVPITLYPLHLISLLKSSNAVVKAIALVDAIEKFWPQKEGEEILKATTENSTRVFVFREREHLKANLSVLKRHAEKYNVHALSFNRLAAECPEYVQDFSIIGGTSTPLLAYYIESSGRERGSIPLKMIRFSASVTELSRHEEVMNTILNISTEVPKSFDIVDDNLVEDLLNRVFKPEFREFGRRQVEMSAYIEVDQYDAHEEEHAYYQDMMEHMVELLREHREKEGLSARVLELGAGTGISTKRLAAVDKLDITALEIDWACFHILKKNMGLCAETMTNLQTKFTAKNEDSRKYDPAGTFRLIFSSFSDHHIYFLDKEKYLKNVRKNLDDNGLFIVGDEFLPEHDETDAKARRDALETYHQHIISTARQAGYPMLVNLEERALESGLREWGDFKVSCEHYESLVARSGFKMIHKHKVGPLDRDDLGGVYVYALSKESR